MISSSTPSQSGSILTQEAFLAAFKSDNPVQHLQRLFMSSSATPSQSGPILTQETLSAALECDNPIHYLQRLITPSSTPSQSGPILTQETLSAALKFDNPVHYPASGIHDALEDPKSDLEGFSNARVCDITWYNRSGACYSVFTTRL